MALSPSLRKLKDALEGAGVAVGADMEAIISAATVFVQRGAEEGVKVCPEELPPKRPVSKTKKVTK